MKKAVIFDTGVLITLSMNCLLDILRELKKKSNAEFIITKEVEHEAVIRPMKITRFKLGAMRIKSLIDDGTLVFPEAVGIQQKEISSMAQNVMKSANNLFYEHQKPIHIIDLGESSILALSKLLRDKGIKNVIAMDERTTRMLCEKPNNLHNLLERKLHTKLKEVGKRDDTFHQSSFIRSTEVIYVAFKKGIIKDTSAEMLDALLYGAKFKGAAISGDEIREIERL
jgi:predicted house-cleaning noncanonical NTP pyrophosphatase (MazG superfamily)